MKSARDRRPRAPGSAQVAETEEMIRVDHAGEYGARRIYEGQLAVLEARATEPGTLAAIRRMA